MGSGIVVGGVGGAIDIRDRGVRLWASGTSSVPNPEHLKDSLLTMATRKARYVVPAAVLAAALMVSGCGGDSSTATPPKTDPAPPTDTKTPAQLAAEATQALDALKQAIDAVMDDSETSVVTRAEGELTKARTAVAKVPAAERVTLSRRLGTLESDLTGAKDSRTSTMVKRGEAMYAAMGPADVTTQHTNALGNLETNPYLINRTTGDSGSDAGTTAGTKGQRFDFRIDPEAGAGSIPTGASDEAVFFIHQDSDPHLRDGMTPHETKLETVAKRGMKFIGTLDTVGDKWYVSEYKRTTGDGAGQVTDTVRLYTDRIGGMMRPLAIKRRPEAMFSPLPGQSKPLVRSAAEYDGATRTVTINQSTNASGLLDFYVRAPYLASRTGSAGTGATTLAETPGDSLEFEGTYYGAKGTYRCTAGIAAPSSAVPSGAPSSPTCTVGTGIVGRLMNLSLSGGANWTFQLDEGEKPAYFDEEYLYFGWWMREGADGMPLAVSAFFESYGGLFSADPNSTNQGAATYVGPVIGLYAIYDPLNQKGDSGEFTATATLNAIFGTTTTNPSAGLSGRIHDFELKNGMENDWSVELKRAAWRNPPTTDSPTEGNSGSVTRQTYSTSGAPRTAWTIGDNTASDAGSWAATLYVEDGDRSLADGGDGNSSPSDILGKFQAERGGTHRMVGAFGTRLQERTLTPPEE